MTIHIRILVNSVNPLDGATPIDFTTAVVTDDPVTGEKVVNLPAQDFGLFDPGSVLPGQTKSLHITHLAVQSKGGAYQAGDSVLIAGPQGGPVGAPVLTARPTRTILDLSSGPGIVNDSGLVPEGLCVPCPVDHVLLFNGVVGAVAGPHTILVSLDPTPRLETNCYQFVAGIGP